MIRKYLKVLVIYYIHCVSEIKYCQLTTIIRIKVEVLCFVLIQFAVNLSKYPLK